MKLLALNLGCGNIPYRSTDSVRWVNLEMIYVPGHPHCTWDESYEYLQAEMQDIARYYDENTVDTIHIVHALEHISTDMSRQTINDSYRVLKPGGQIEIETPDIDKACKLWLDGQQDDRVKGLFWGTMGGDGIGQYHLTGFNFARYKEELEAVGFKNVTEIPVGAGHGKPEPQYDIRVMAEK